jgi:hypothetical protein
VHLMQVDATILHAGLPSLGLEPVRFGERNRYAAWETGLLIPSGTHLALISWHLFATH